METRARYFRIGVFVLCFAAALVLFTLWIARIELVDSRPAYRVFFTGNVTGLREGSPVRYRGVPVGKVSAIKINPADVEEVEVVIHVDPGTPVKTDTTAALDIRGITGNAFVQLSGGSNAAPFLTAPPGELPVILSTPSLLGEVMERAPQILHRAEEIADRVNRILSPENEELITETLRNLHRMSTDLAQAAHGAQQTMDAILDDTRTIERLLVDVQGQTHDVAQGIGDTLAAVRVTLAKVDANTQEGLGDLTKTTEEVRGLATSLRTLSDELSGVMQESRVPIRDFTNVGLYELSRLIIEARELASSLSRVSREIERNPVDFLISGAKKSEPAGAQ